MSFLPTDYKEPSGSKYMKFSQGKNKFRVLSSAIVGNEFWVEEDGGRKPVRKRMNEKFTLPDNADSNSIKHFWAFVVWNYQENAVQILELTQKGIMRSIRGCTENEDYGDPKGYDLTVTREGEGFDTQYTVMPSPPKEIDKAIIKTYEDMNINLEALFSGEDPFTSKEIDFDDIPENL